ncbi:MAG: hypothetical protein HQM03_09885 [Magnetococcales bacterium]|nr:hypothetical protein [Magnetococcales bacterium]
MRHSQSLKLHIFRDNGLDNVATTTLSKKTQTSGTRTAQRTDQAAATLRRAWEIAARGMFKEAVLLWDHAQRLGSEATPPPEILLTWMINARQHNKALHFFLGNEAAIRYARPRVWSTAREVFAVAALTNDPDNRPLPPWNLPPWNQAATALSALQAYCRNEPRAMRTCLVPIDATSPFRPLRAILESLLLPASESERIDALLRDIPDHSPFAPLRAIAQTRTLGAMELAHALLRMPPIDRTPATLLCGVEEKRFKLLIRLNETSQPCQQLALMLNHADLLPPDSLRATLWPMLPDCMEERGRFEKKCGPMPEFDRERLFALHHERQQSNSRASHYWRKCILLLENAPDEDETRVRLSLLYHRLATIEQRYANPSTTQIVELLEKSLGFDPGNQAIWLELLHWKNRLKRDRQEFYRCADQAARRFPASVAVLSIAMSAAMEKGAFKKASGLARRMQKSSAAPEEMRETRLTALANHARKRILDGHFDLARRELTRAARIRPEKNWRLCLLEAMLHFLEGEPQQAEASLEESRALAGPLQVMHTVRAFLEAVGLHLSPLLLDRFRHALVRCDALPPVREEVIGIADLIAGMHPRQPAVSMEIMALLSGYFRKAAVLVYDQEEMRKVCQTLALTQRHPLLALYGRLAETRWPAEAIFTYFRARGQCEGDAWRLTDRDFHLLLQAGEDLLEKDPEGAAMINDMLAIPASQRPSGPWHSIPLSPAKIPRPLENKLLRELRARVQEAMDAYPDEAATPAFRKRMIDTLLPTPFGQRGPLVLGYLIDRVCKGSDRESPRRPAPPPNAHRQLELDLSLE